MIETTSFPVDVTTVAAVAGLLGVLVVFYYSFTRSYTYEVRRRPTQSVESTESTES
jgi:hypothetical protein